YVAHLRVTSNAELHERHYRHVAEEVLRLSNSDQSIAGTREIVQGLFFYLPEARPIALPSSTDSTALAAVRANDMVIICSAADETCRSGSIAIEGPSAGSTNVTFRRSFLGFTSRSEERRVGKECRSRWWRYRLNTNVVVKIIYIS